MLLFIHCQSINHHIIRFVSIHLMLLFIGEKSFDKLLSSMFQYISCYSLSERELLDSIVILVFQYISCYSLSFGFYWCNTLYHRFNTSHVTLYLEALPFYLPALSLVSIHLMLLFIGITSDFLIPIPSFNTSHVTLYPLPSVRIVYR